MKMQPMIIRTRKNVTIILLFEVLQLSSMRKPLMFET